MSTILDRLPLFALKLSLILIVLWAFYARGCREGFRVVGGKPAIVSTAAFERVVRYIPGADPDTFKALEITENSRASYAVDAKRAYIGYWGHAMPIESADPNSFRILSPDGAYTKDENRVYWFGVEIEGAEPGTFRVIREPFTVDSRRPYAGVYPIEVHSLEDFEVLHVGNFDPPIKNRGNRTIIKERKDHHTPGWSRDGVAYYWGVDELKNANYDSTVILNSLHAKDDVTVYYKGNPIPGADAESFVVVGPGSVAGRDKNAEYKSGKRITVRKVP